jgi:phage portal protein BeeE
LNQITQAISGRVGRWLLVKSGNWQQLFDRGFTADDGSQTTLNKPYAQSPWIMRAVKSVSEPIAGVPLVFTIGETEYTDKTLAEFWKSPVIGLDSWSDCVDAWVGWLKLKGEAFIIADDTFFLKVPGSEPTSKLILARPDCMKELCVGGVLVGWEWTDGNGTRHRLLPEQVYQSKLWNPYNAYRGLGELEAAQVAAETDYLAGKYEGRLAANSGDQGMTVTTDGGQPSQEQIDQITTQLRRKRERLLRGEFTDLFLAGGLKVQSPEVRGADVAFQSSRVTKRHEIAVAFGVPPSLFDVKASYSFGKDSDYRALIVNTCIPTAQRLCRVISKIASQQTGKQLEAYCDFDEHPVMQEVRRERITSAQALWAMGVPLKDASDYLDMDLPRVAGDDVGYLPFSVQPVGEPMDETDFAETTPVEEMKHAIRALRAAAKPQPLACGCAGDIEHKAADPTWRKKMQQRRGALKAFESKFNRALMDARKETLAKLDSLEAKGIHNKAVAADFVFDLAAFASDMMRGMRAVAIGAITDAGQNAWTEIGKTDPFIAPPNAVSEFLKKRENKLSNVPSDIFDKIRDAIQEGLDGGESRDSIAARVRAEFNEISTGRSKVIAQTETAAAFGFGELEGYRAGGVRRRQWLTSLLPSVRPSHQEAEGQTVGIDEPFRVGDALLMYPGDEDGPAEEVINCHCTTVAIQEPSNE